MKLTLENNSMENNDHIWDHSQAQIQENSKEAKPESPESFDRSALLLQAKERLMLFMENLSEHRRSEIRYDVLQHCQQLNKNRKIIAAYISDQSILKMVTCRIQKMMKNKRLKKNWSEEDVKILVWIVSKYCDRHNIANIEKQLTVSDWEHIARLIPGVNGTICMFKWLSIKKTNLSNCSWNSQESQMLKSIIQNQQMKGYKVNNFTNLNWKVVAEELYFNNTSSSKVFRSSKQCRQHWNCFLNPTLKKGPWLIQEDIQLLTLIKGNNGSKKWSEIVYFFEGRTQNALKNRYTLLLDKQKKVSKSKQQISLIEDCLQKCYEEQLSINRYKGQIAIEPIVDLRDQLDLKESYQMMDLNQKESDNFKSQVNTISSSTPTPSISRVNTQTKIHYLTSGQQLEFFQWIRQRSDIKKCCLKNGSFQIEEF